MSLPVPLRPAFEPDGWTRTSVTLPDSVIERIASLAHAGERKKSIRLSSDVVTASLIRAALELLGELDVRGLTKHDGDELTRRVAEALRDNAGY
jgi:hypothetical protein